MIIKNPRFALGFAFFLLVLLVKAQTFSKYFVFNPTSQMNASIFTNCHELRHQNGYLVTAEKYSSQNIRNTILIRTDNTMNETWSTMLSFNAAAVPFNNINFSDVGELLNGNYFLFGQAGVPGNPYYVVFVLDTMGQVLHYTALHDTLNSSNAAVIPKMTIAADSSLIITLAEYEKFGFYRLDQNLNLLSSAVFSNNPGYSWGRGGMLLADTTILFPGDTGGLMLTKTDLSGTILWTNRYTGIGRCFSMCQTATGSIYIGGMSTTPSGNAVSYAAKISASGQLVWYHTYLMANSLTMSAVWEMYPSGNNLMLYSDSAMFEIDTLGFPVSTGYTVNSDNYKVINPCSGNDFMLAGPIYQPALQAYRHTVIRFNSSSISGCMQPRAIVTTVASSPRQPLFIHRLTHVIQSETIVFSDTTVHMDYDFLNGCPMSNVGITENPNAESSFSVFPNPASDLLHIHYQLKNQDAVLSFQLTDVSGRVVKSGQAGSSAENEFLFSLAGMAEGMYTISIYENGVAAGHRLFSIKH